MNKKLYDTFHIWYDKKMCPIFSQYLAVCYVEYRKSIKTLLDDEIILKFLMKRSTTRNYSYACLARTLTINFQETIDELYVFNLLKISVIMTLPYPYGNVDSE